MDQLICILKLKPILGYTDNRTIRAWCRKNNVPLIVLGKKTYVPQNALNKLVQEKLSLNSNTDYNNSESVSDIIGRTQWTELNDTTETVGDIPNRKERKPKKSSHSVAAISLLKNIHSAK